MSAARGAISVAQSCAPFPAGGRCPHPGRSRNRTWRSPGVAWSVDGLYIVRQSDYPSIETNHDRTDAQDKAPLFEPLARQPASLRISTVIEQKILRRSLRRATPCRPRPNSPNSSRSIARLSARRCGAWNRPGSSSRRRQQAPQGHASRPRGDCITRRAHAGARRRNVHRIMGSHARRGARVAALSAEHGRARTSNNSKQSSRPSKRPAAPTVPSAMSSSFSAGWRS